MNISKEKCKKSNRGFSVISVIIAVAFIGILAMLVLYISAANFQMKTTDLKAKDSFYTAENALDEIRAGLQTVVGEAMTDAYVEVLEAYADESTSNVEGREQIRQKAFQDQYLVNLRDSLLSKDHIGTDDYYDMNIINGFVDLEKNMDLEKESLKIVNPADTYPEMTKGGTESGILLKNLKIIYVDSKGLASIIETDIRLGLPQVQFPTPSTLPDLMNMIVVANKGIVFGAENAAENTGEGKGITINGSIYAGQNIGPDGKLTDPTSILLHPNVKVTVEGGEHLVSLGEIEVKDGAEFKNTVGTDIWAQGLNVTSGTVELSGRTYFSDDLTLNTTTNKSTGSTVKISGEYYGYGSPESAKASYFGQNSFQTGTAGETKPNKYDNWTNTALSSAIIVNGKGATLDLSGAAKFMLAGNSYVSGSKVKPGDHVDPKYKNSKDIVTGESLTVKGNQIAYLAPSSCFRNDSYTNPMTFTQYAELIEDKPEDFFDMDKAVDALGGKSLNSIGLAAADPIQKVFYSNADSGFVYFYLNFATPKDATTYFRDYYNNETVKKNMDAYLDFYLGGEGKGIFMKDNTAFLRYVTNGNVLTYKGKTGEDGERQAGEGNLVTPGIYPITNTQEQTNYQNTWFALTRKMIPSYDLLKEKVKKGEDGPEHNEKDPERYVYENLVDEDSLKDFIEEQKDAGNLEADGSYSFQVKSREETLEAYVIDNENGEPFHIDEDKAENTRLVVATGDVVIEENVPYRGIIMAKGTLTMMPGSGLSSEPLEAAKVFQAQRDSDEKVPMDFFWEGDKYILGSSTTQNNPSGEVNVKDTYDLSECISYENWVKK